MVLRPNEDDKRPNYDASTAPKGAADEANEACRRKPTFFPGTASK
jgi:hypothetical protein